MLPNQPSDSSPSAFNRASTSDRRRELFARARAIHNATGPAASPSPRDVIDVRGSVRLVATYADGSQKPLVEDPNLVVTMGRRVMSRIVGGGLLGPTITQGTQAAIRIVRDTTASPTSAYVKTYQIPGTNEYVIEGWTSASGVTPAFRIQYTSGQTLNGLVSAISAVTGWKAEVLNGLGSVDGTFLVQCEKAPCLGTGSPGAYAAGIGTFPHARTLYALAGISRAVTVPDLTINRIRFGTQGHDPNDGTLGKEVLAIDENLTAPLRAADLGNASLSQDYIDAVVSYTNTGQVAFTASLGQVQANGLGISEVGLFTPLFMFARKNFGQITKSNLFSIDCTWTLIF